MTRLTLASEPGVSVAAGCGMLCMVYRGESRDSYPERAVGWTDEAAKAVGVPSLPVMVVIEDHAESPDNEGRRGYAESLKRSAPQMECFAQVILAGGLKGVAYRAIASTIHLVAQHPTETKVFRSVEDAAAWICGRSSVCTVTPEVLLSFVDSVRSAPIK